MPNFVVRSHKTEFPTRVCALVLVRFLVCIARYGSTRIETVVGAVETHPEGTIYDHQARGSFQLPRPPLE